VAFCGHALYVYLECLTSYGQFKPINYLSRLPRPSPWPVCPYDLLHVWRHSSDVTSLELSSRA